MVKISKNKRRLKEDNKKNSPKKIEKQHSLKIYSITLALIAFIISYLFIPDATILKPAGINSFLFYLVSFINAAITYIGLSSSKHEVKKIVKVIFSILLFLFIFFSLFQNQSTAYGSFMAKLVIYKKFLVVTLSITGLLASYLSRARINEYINSQFQVHSPTKRKTIEKVKTGIFNKKSLPTSSVFILIILLAIFTNFFKLDHFDLYSDEAQVTQAAAGYYHTGEFKAWSFVHEKLEGRKYNRAWPHLFLVAQSYRLFGITPWSSRFPSVLFGILFIIVGYFITTFFIKNKEVALLSVFSFALYFNYLQLFRWARMYALVIPLFLITLYFGYRFITEKNDLKLLSFINRLKWGKYFDYNYRLSPVFIVLLYFGFYLHVNFLFVLLVLYLISIVYLFYLKEPKYITAILAGFIFIVLGFFFVPNVEGIGSYLTNFKEQNAGIYTRLFFNYPLSIEVSGALLIIGIGIFFLTKNQVFRKHYLLFYLGIFVAWILFSFIFNYPVSFRYMSFIAAMPIIMVLSILSFILKSIYKAWVWYIAIFLIIASSIIHFYSNYEQLYVRNPLSPAKPSIAMKTLVNKHQKDELIYRHWGADYYYMGLDKNSKLLELGGHKGKAFSEIFDTLKNHKSGWLTWMSHNTWRMDSALIDFANLYFTKYHGYGVDQTGVELYHYTDSNLVDSNRFELDRLMPGANLNLENSYSIAFWIKPNINNTQSPFTIDDADNILIEIKQANTNPLNLACYYSTYTKDSIICPNLVPDQWQHICWYQYGGEQGHEFGLYINGKLQDSSILKTNITGLVKFKLNPYFVGELNDIRIYDFVLNQRQINKIIKNIDNPDSNELIADGKKYSTLFHWQKK